MVAQPSRELPVSLGTEGVCEHREGEARSLWRIQEAEDVLKGEGSQARCTLSFGKARVYEFPAAGRGLEEGRRARSFGV